MSLGVCKEATLLLLAYTHLMLKLSSFLTTGTLLGARGWKSLQDQLSI